jgi:predicted HAD superfamily Cof-like phosphohydrolase
MPDRDIEEAEQRGAARALRIEAMRGLEAAEKARERESPFTDFAVHLMTGLAQELARRADVIEADGIGPAANPSPSQYVEEFHRAFGIAVRTQPEADIPESDLRTRLLAEEVQEYYDAVAAGDVVEVADALADIVYVAFGTALNHGIDLDAVLAEVHRSNMSKLGSDGRPILREDGKVIKGPDYFRPDVAGVLFPARPHVA